MTDDRQRFEVLSGGPSGDEREERLESGAANLAIGPSGSAWGRDRALLVASAGLVGFGICAILLGWYGASHSTLIEEQVPYLISGGLLGVALAIVGAVVFFAHWLTVAIREARVHEAARHADHQELVTILRALGAAPDQEVPSNGRARGAGAQRPLRRSSRSS